MQTKTGVKIGGAKPELIIGLLIAQSVFQLHGIELVVTSVTDGNHMPGSKHYEGFAADLRCRLSTEMAKIVLRDLKAALGDDWDAILESAPAHFHIEYDPDSH